MEETKLTKGQIIGASIAHFMTAKHNMNTRECIDMVAKLVDEELQKNESINNLIRQFAAGADVHIKGLLYTSKVNPDSFVKALARLIK